MNDKLYYIMNKNKIIEDNKKYYQEHKQERLNYSKSYYNKNKNDLTYRKKREKIDFNIIFKHELITLHFD